MSRIGRMPIKLSEGVKAEMTADRLVVSGPRGILEMKVLPECRIKIDEGLLRVEIDDPMKNNLSGLTRSLIANMVIGVSRGWTKELELNGTGYRASTNGTELQLALGFSHPVNVKAPEGIKFEVKENKITVLGNDKIVVGEVAAKIRRLKPADVYKIKGFKYVDEVIIKKPGKAAKAGA